MSLRILIHFIAEITIFTIGVAVLYFGGMIVCASMVWQGDEWLYGLLKWISMHSQPLIFLLCALGYLVIFVRSWLKTLGYLEDIVEATESIYVAQNDLIELPADLKEVEGQMNRIKLHVQNNERAAREAEQRKNDLVVYLAHDLKTPLTSVIGYLTLLRDENQISEDLREKYLSISLEKAQRLEDLINEFFDITRFNLSNLTLNLSRVNLTRLLEQLVFEFQPMLKEKGLQCALHVAPDVAIKCDADKMQRVLDNLLRNAVNYSFEDSVITISVKQFSNCIKLAFKNQGNTIPREKLDRIFEQFYRLDTARTTQSGGAGLGLAIAKEIIELHQGAITAFSENEVIVFTVEIPLL